jgi:hypothetical protein
MDAMIKPKIFLLQIMAQLLLLLEFPRWLKLDSPIQFKNFSQAKQLHFLLRVLD